MVGTPDGTAERAGVARRNQAGPAMATHVVVRREGAVAGADHQHTFSGDIQYQVITRPGQLLFPAGAEPFPVEDALPFPAEDLIREVEIAMKSSLHRLNLGPGLGRSPAGVTQDLAGRVVATRSH